jgi:hypothetical protein
MSNFEIKIKFDGVKIIHNKEMKDWNAVEKLLEQVRRKFR